MSKLWDKEHETAIYTDRIVGIRKVQHYNGKKQDYIWEGSGCVGSVWTIVAVLDTGALIPLERVSVSTSVGTRGIYQTRDDLDRCLDNWLQALDKLRGD